MGGAFSSTYDWNRFLHQLFLSEPKLLRLVTAKKWLRALFTNFDFATEVGMPWEITLQVLDSGRNTKIFGKGGATTLYYADTSINRALGFSVQKIAQKGRRLILGRDIQFWSKFIECLGRGQRIIRADI